MDIRDYSAFVDANLGNSQRPLHTLAWMSMLEVAEMANEVKRIHTKDGGQLTDERKGAILEEMGDEFYYFVARLNNLGFTLDDVMRANISKLEKRNGRKDYRSFRSGMYGYSPVPDVPGSYNI